MSLRAPRRFIATLAVPAVVAAGVAFAVPAQADHEEKYKGSALALRAQLGIAGSSVLDEILPSLVTYPEGATDMVLELPEELADVAVLKVLNVSSGLDSDKVLVSNANVSKANVLAGLVTAKVLNADCTAQDENVEGDSQIAELSLAGMKIPVDPGPNVEIEIPEALQAFLSGGITIDEQTELPGGKLRVRALHINLVVAPGALEEALASVTKVVRDAAEQVKVAVEAATGKTLEALVGQERTAPAPKAAPKVTSKAAPKVTSKRINVAQQDEAGAQAAEEAANTEAVESARDTSALESSDAAQSEAGTAKTDAADISATEAAGDSTAADAAVADRAEADAKSAAVEQSTGVTETSTDAGATDAAARAARTDAAISSERVAGEQARAQKSAGAKNDAADLSALERAEVPAVDSDVLGALGVDVVISEVVCQGAEAEAQVAELPDTGGDSMLARNIAISGLGLLAAGSLVVFITRRRQHVS